MTYKNSSPLPEETILAGRYVLGSPRAVSDAGIAYNAFDKKLRMPCEVFEFLPTDCAVRGRKGAVVAKEGTDPNILADKCRKLRNSAVQRFKDSDSAIYDLISANGSVYLIQVCAKNNAYPGTSSVPLTDETDDTVTREIGGLFASSLPQHSDDTPISDEPTVTFPHEVLQDSTDTDTAPSQAESEPAPVAFPAAPKQELRKAETVMTPSTSHKAEKPVFKPVKQVKQEPVEYHENSDDDKKLNMKLLIILLTGVAILLILGVIIFVSVLQQITGTVEDPNSLLGVPVTKIEEIMDDDYLIVGVGSTSEYAPGMVIEEKQNGNILHVLINGVSPSYIMPNLNGMTYESAQALLNRTPYCNTVGTLNTTVTVEEVADNTYPTGAVISQSPNAGDVVAANTTVTLKIAVNSKSTTAGNEIQMPDLCGMTYSSAMMGHPVLISDRIYSADVPAGKVMYQSPAAGENWVDGGICYVVVSAGPEKTAVPNLLYYTLEEAREMLYSKGLSVKTEYTYSSNVKEGLVIAQSLSDSTEAAFGETVVLTVSGDGKAHSGPSIRNNTDAAVLRIGDTCTLEFGTSYTIVYHSTNPAVVTVSDTGTVTAVSAGSAVVTASIEGTTVSMPITVEYPKQNVFTGIAQINEDFSLSTLIEGDSVYWKWNILQGKGKLTDNSIFHTDTAGITIFGSTDGSATSLLLLTVKETNQISIAKDLIKNAESAKKLLEDNGLICILKEEYSASHPAGTVLKIQYSGYSDDEQYHFIAGSTVTLIVSSGKPEVTSIVIAEKPAKLVYTVGEKLDSAGMVVTVIYEDGSEENITSGYSLSYDFSEAGRKTVAVSYGNRKASFHVEVKSTATPQLSITSLPDKTTYFVNDTLSTVGLEIQITHPDGTSKKFVNGYSVSYSFDKVGPSEVIVSMNGLSATFTVTIVENKVEYLELVKYPNKVFYLQGEKMDTTGMQLRAYYGDDSYGLITSGWTVTADMTTVVGDCVVVVAYGGKTVSFTVTVKAPEIQTVEIQKLPTQNQYYEGDSIDLSGLVLEITMSNAKTEKVSYPNDAISCTYDFSEAGEKTVTVKYLEYECTFRVTVKPLELVELSVHTLPSKLIYLPGETLDTTGLVLLATYKNDIQKKITTGYTYSYDFSTPGDVKVNVFFDEKETSFYVTLSQDALLYTDPSSLNLKPGEYQAIRVYNLLADQTVSFTLSDPSVISVKNIGDSLLVTALSAGECTITLRCTTLTATCKVTVSDTDTTGSFTAQLTVSDKTDQYFMKTLVLTGSNTQTVEVEFSAVIHFDPSLLHLADYDTRYDGITMQYDEDSTILLSGKVKIPQGEKVTVAYCIFLGSDTSACVLSVK